MISLIKNILGCPRFMALGLALISAAALGMALISEYFFGLEPCILCLYQRYPYGIVIALGIIGFALSFKSEKSVAITLLLSGIAMIINSIIAFYHTGVELKWWPSHIEGCAVPDLGSDPDNILAALETSQAVRCDEIPWSDPILNLSMANYNVVFCLGLGVIALISARLIWKKSS
jgi:disulfide bond formation protein DsbB